MPPIAPQNVTPSIASIMLADVFPVVLDLEKSQGNRLVDSITGRSYLDCYSYVASNPIGHNHPKLFNPDFERRLLRAAKHKPACSDFYTEEMAHFVTTFKRVAVPDEFKHLFLIEGGSAAVENALKTAFDWKVRKNFAAGIKKETGTQIIHFKEAFHGRGGYTLSLTNTDNRKTKYFPKFSWPRITNPKITFPLNDASLAAVKDLECQAAGEIEKAIQDSAGDIAAIIIETVQGEGGDNHYRPEFFAYLREVADRTGVLLIFDEIQSGLGVTGKMWAFQHSGVTPDVFSFGKKVQVCGILATERIDEVKDNAFEETSRLNSTWGGNLTDMVRAARYLEIIEEDRLVENAAVVGEYLLKQLERLSYDRPQTFNNARGRGLMCSIDLPTAEARDKMLDETYNRGLLVLKCGESGLRLRPALTFSTAEVDELMTILSQSAEAIG